MSWFRLFNLDRNARVAFALSFFCSRDFVQLYDVWSGWLLRLLNTGLAGA